MVVKVEGEEEEIDRVRPLVAAAAVRVFVFFSLLFPNNDLITFSSSLSLFHFFLPFFLPFLPFFSFHSLSLISLSSLTLSHSLLSHSHSLSHSLSLSLSLSLTLSLSLSHTHTTDGGVVIGANKFGREIGPSPNLREFQGRRKKQRPISAMRPSIGIDMNHERGVNVHDPSQQWYTGHYEDDV